MLSTYVLTKQAALGSVLIAVRHSSIHVICGGICGHIQVRILKVESPL